MAHKNWTQLKKLISLLDDERNDIFLHLDAKHKPSDSVIQEILSVPKDSNIHLVRSITVNWGSYSFVEAELVLLKESTQTGHYDNYHLISGQDLPLKKQDEIHSFFAIHKGKEFVGIGKNEWIQSVQCRCNYYWYLQEYVRDSRNILQKIDKCSVLIQKLMGVNRLKNCTFSAGSNWFSITDDFARYVCSMHDQIKRQFRYTKCADESFLQILAIESGFSERRFKPEESSRLNSIMRSIDWDRGSPYTYRSEDFTNLIASDYLFARKFDEQIDNEIIDLIYNHLIS